MITIENERTTMTDLENFRNGIPQNSLQFKIFNIINESPNMMYYNSLDELDFEMKLRTAIVQASVELNESNFSFAVFRNSSCNEHYWRSTSNGGFQLRDDVSPSVAIIDIYKSSQLYATECATPMVIICYKALLSVYGDDLFDRLFPEIYLMNWSRLDKRIALFGQLSETSYYAPGDRCYFSNPDVRQDSLEYQGENAILLDQDTYYAPGMGITSANEIITALNQVRQSNATRSAFLRNTVGRLNYQSLYRLMQ